MSYANKVKNFYDEVGESPQNADGTIKGEDTDEMHNKLKPTVVDVAALAGLGTSISTMVLTEGHIVDAACYSTCLCAPLIAYQKRSLNSMGGLRGQQNILRESVNEMSAENDKLQGSIERLSETVDG